MVAAKWALIVEDDPDLVLLLTELLNMNGMKADVALSHEEVVSLCSKKISYSLIFLDLMLRGQDSRELFSLLKQSEAGRLAAIYLASGRDGLSKVAASWGATGWVGKPYQIDEIDRIVQSCLHSQ